MQYKLRIDFDFDDIYVMLLGNDLKVKLYRWHRYENVGLEEGPYQPLCRDYAVYVPLKIITIFLHF